MEIQLVCTENPLYSQRVWIEREDIKKVLDTYLKANLNSIILSFPNRKNLEGFLEAI